MVPALWRPVNLDEKNGAIKECGWSIIIWIPSLPGSSRTNETFAQSIVGSRKAVPPQQGRRYSKPMVTIHSRWQVTAQMYTDSWDDEHTRVCVSKRRRTPVTSPRRVSSSAQIQLESRPCVLGSRHGGKISWWRLKAALWALVREQNSGDGNSISSR